MDLIIWRHADAEDGTPDSERKLTAKGEKQARRVAAWLADRLDDDYVVLSSPARRARDTARALSARYETTEDLGAAATPQSVLKAAGWPRRAGTVVVVGHQPTLGQTVALVLTGKDAQWSLKKGGLWWIQSRDEDDFIVRAAIAPDLVK
jgi:phosphohistidine phosphatase